MNGRTKLKTIGISALLIAALLSGVVSVSAVSEDGPKDKSQTIPDGAINDTELAWRDDLQDLYHRYNVSEDDVLFVKNDRPHYLDRTILDKDTVVIATGTGEPPGGLKEGANCEITICTEELCMIWAQGKDLSAENLMQNRGILTDAFFKRFGEKLSDRYVCMSEDLKVSEDTKLVAYGFRIRPDGVTEEYGGYCGQDFSGYKEAMNKTERWFSTLDEEPSNKRITLSTQDWSRINTYTNDHTFEPYGAYSTTTHWYWDDVETVADTDYFMLKSKFTMVAGHQKYGGNHWCNHRGYIRHNWTYYDYPGTRHLWDSQPRDESGESTISITLTGISVSLTWPMVIPDYGIDDQSDYLDELAKWEVKINPASSNFGGDTVIVEPGSAMHCSQNEARTGEWIGLAFFRSKPAWKYMDMSNFGETYSPAYQGYSNCVMWTGSEYVGTPPDCPLDMNGDDYVNAQDIVWLLTNGQWGYNPGHVWDLNGDGYVNAQDVVEALTRGYWGACP